MAHSIRDIPRQRPQLAAILLTEKIAADRARVARAEFWELVGCGIFILSLAVYFWILFVGIPAISLSPGNQSCQPKVLEIRRG